MPCYIIGHLVTAFLIISLSAAQAQGLIVPPLVLQSKINCCIINLNIDWVATLNISQQPPGRVIACYISNPAFCTLPYKLL
ncbi:hypothetical protein QL093DRAFT_1165245 [Fusarium oxysporum]|nr:hypothetical protein QL093DRAFT_1165245 [Fusarium oxysporum]